MQTLAALQFLDSIPLPGHGSPPFCGAGCVQFRVRICTPGPHVALQVSQELQWPQLPSIAVIFQRCVIHKKHLKPCLCSVLNLVFNRWQEIPSLKHASGSS